MAKLADPNTHTPYLKAGIMGPSGSGKSSLGATAPRPLILLSEKQGKDPALARARALKLPDPTIVEVDSLQDYRDCIKSMHGDRSKPFRWVAQDGTCIVEMDPWPETLVLDSLTDACELVEASIRQDAPPKKGEDGLDTFSQRHWNELKRRCQRLIRAFRDLDCNVLFLTLVDEKTTETSDGVTTRSIVPMLPMRKLPDILMQATNVCGYMQRKVVRDEDGSVLLDGESRNMVLAVKVITNAPSYVKVKPCEGLDDLEVPDFTSWVERYREHVNGGA
jgi:hypothetical protein